MSRPRSSTRPSSGRSKPAISRRVVVLPEPDGPRSVKNSPRATSRSTWSTATTSPYVFRIPTQWTSGVEGAGVGAASTSGSSRTCVAKCFLQQLEPPPQLLVGDRKRRQQADHVAVRPAGQEQQAALVGRLDHGRREGGRLLGQLERAHRAEPAVLADGGDAGRDPVERLAQAVAQLVCAGAKLRGRDRVEHDGGGGAGDGVAAEGAAEA